MGQTGIRRGCVSTVSVHRDEVRPGNRRGLEAIGTRPWRPDNDDVQIPSPTQCVDRALLERRAAVLNDHDRYAERARHQNRFIVDHRPDARTGLVRLLLWYWGRRGGGARMLYELGTAVEARPESSTVLAINRSNQLRAKFERSPLTVRVDRVPGVINLPGPRSIGNVARRLGTDVAVQVMGHPLSFPATLSLRAAGIATIEFVHDAVPHPGDRAWLYDLSTAGSRRCSTHLVALSEHVLHQLRSQPGTRTKPITVIPHGPLYAGHSGALVVPGRVLFAGRIRAYKGLDLLLEAWPLVLQSCPEATLVVAGDGDLGALRSGFEQLGATVVNRWLGDEELPELISEAHVLVLPYREASQSGVATIAVHYGVPIVATAVGGLTEQVTTGRGGKLVAPGADKVALSLAIIETLRGPPRPIIDEGLIGPTWEDVASQLVAVARQLKLR